MMWIRIFLTGGLVLCASGISASGQVCVSPNPDENISITVTGEAKGIPDMMYIELAAEATAGNAGDAFEQCKQKADTAARAIRALNIPSAEVVRKMYEFSSATAGSPYGMAPPTATPAGTKVTQVVEVKVKLENGRGTDDLAGVISQVLDAANKAGVGFMQAAPWQAQMMDEVTLKPVRYVLEDATDVKMQAVGDSLAQVKQITAALAKSGVKTGELLGMRYSEVEGSPMLSCLPASVTRALGQDKKSVSSSSPDEVTVSCTWTFIYEVGADAESKK